MKKNLVKTGFNIDDIISFGNMFLIANGRYGFRGTLEEFDKSFMVGLNVLGLYDKFKDKWRESVNLPNPLYFVTSFNDKRYLIQEEKPLNHHLELDIFNGVLYRETEYDKFIIKSERFLSSVNKDLLVHKYVVKAKEEGFIKIEFKVDLDIYEINGPHFKKKDLTIIGDTHMFRGVTNEKKKVSTYTRYISKDHIQEANNSAFIEKYAQKEDEITIFTYSLISIEESLEAKSLVMFSSPNYELIKKEHTENFAKKWEISRVIVDEEDSQFELDYSIYHLLILEDQNSYHSIPARGLSGETYKGAIFWDTEAFILPFFTLVNPSFARNLLIYRINTLKGAKKKAKSFGYKGAFYAWESQDSGLEQCSKFNVTDPVTNEPIRTYFDEKQIHISGDIVLAFDRYISFTDDKSILVKGYEVIYECAKFYMSRGTFRNNKYHFDDVIGPDEYHERINDNAFTNYLVYRSLDIAIKYYDRYSIYVKNIISKKTIIKYRDLIYLPVANKEGIIEQFDGYFSLENVTPDIVKSRAKNDREYLGFLAASTKTIKQADVISLLVMIPEAGLSEFKENNYQYYLPYTEHGSSLSSSMYSILGSKVGDKELAYSLFRKSSGIDLGTNQKMYAGGIYIGGTHPASNAGAYLSVIFGFAGLCLDENEFKINPNLPDNIKHIEFKFFFKKKLYKAVIDKDIYQVTEVVNYD